jgi:signal peptidase I
VKKEIPILFSTPMVQAILEGRKSMTRRTNKLDRLNICPDRWDLINDFKSDFGDTITFQFLKGKHGELIKCPYGKPGDVLWVREEHYRYGQWVEKEGTFTKTGRQKWQFIPHTDEIRYFDNPPEEFRKGMHNNDRHHIGWYKRLARFMPKSACRIWQEVTDIRVQRLHDISEADAKAEGASDTLKFDDMSRLKDLNWTIPIPFHMHQFGFLALWCKINGTKNWEVNPWVWVISFNVLSTTGKPVEETIAATSHY